MEEWRDIQGYEGLYQVSNYGRVKSIDRILPNGKTHKGKVLYVHLINGYPTVSLCKNSKQHNHKIHRLVAQAFIPNPDNKPCVDHIDADRANNNVVNLRWVTYQENNNSPLSYKARSTAISTSRSVMVAQYDKGNSHHTHLVSRGSIMRITFFYLIYRLAQSNFPCASPILMGNNYHSLSHPQG